MTGDTSASATGATPLFTPSLGMWRCSPMVLQEPSRLAWIAAALGVASALATAIPMSLLLYVLGGGGSHMVPAHVRGLVEGVGVASIFVWPGLCFGVLVLGPLAWMGGGGVLRFGAAVFCSVAGNALCSFGEIALALMMVDGLGIFTLVPLLALSGAVAGAINALPFIRLKGATSWSGVWPMVILGAGMAAIISFLVMGLMEGNIDVWDGPAAAFVLLLIIALMWQVPVAAVTPLRLRNRARLDQCYHCQYLLTGLQSDTCPECGQPIAPEQAPHITRIPRQTTPPTPPGA